MGTRDTLSAAPLPVVPGRRRSLVLPWEAASVPQARRFVRSVLQEWDCARYEEAATLLVSELVGNVVLHARSDIEVELLDGPDGPVLVVSDDSPVLPVVRRHSREAATGRGLWLLEQYSSAHGVDLSRPGPGKSVWAVLHAEVPDPEEGGEAALATWLDSIEGL